MDLVTPRCRVRRFGAADLADYMSYRNDLDWMRFQGYKGLTKEQYAVGLLVEPDLSRGAQFAIERTTDARLIGDVYLRGTTDTLWIGYTVAPTYARQGYASEVVGALVEWARQAGYAAVRAGVLPENTASVNLLVKAGFRYAGRDGEEWVHVRDLCTP